ncbi:mucin-5AC-like [Ylistrum balloti]|uniref:mucin-5AC-like n=1 Tax=Ylistrum balloti TaxID=509963 RepID=UPI0029057FAB|nr:mucin-5AC-like [Ylistrum balloti]
MKCSRSAESDSERNPWSIEDAVQTILMITVYSQKHILTSVTYSAIAEPEQYKYGCYGTQNGNVYMDAQCSSDERIVVRDVSAGAKLNATGCERFTSFVEEEELCCTPADTDCTFDYSVTGGFDANYKYQINCTGKSECDKIRVDTMETPDSCSSGFLDTSNYLYMYYYCIPVSDIGSTDSAILQGTTDPSYLYLWSPNFPNPISSTVTSTSCSIETACDSQITVSVLDLRLQSDSTGTCRQNLTIHDNSSVIVLDCSDNNLFIIRDIFTSQSNYLEMTFSNNLGATNGYFWIGFSSDTCGSLKISCPAVVPGYDCVANATAGSSCVTTTLSTTTAESTTSTTLTTTTNIPTTTTTADSTTSTTLTTTTNIPTTTADSTTSTTLTTTTNIPTTTTTADSTISTTLTTTTNIPTTTTTADTTTSLVTTTDEPTTTTDVPTTTTTIADTTTTTDEPTITTDVSSSTTADTTTKLTTPSEESTITTHTTTTEIHTTTAIITITDVPSTSTAIADTTTYTTLHTTTEMPNTFTSTLATTTTSDNPTTVTAVAETTPKFTTSTAETTAAATTTPGTTEAPTIIPTTVKSTILGSSQQVPIGSEPASASFPWWFILIAILIIAVAGIIVLVRWKKRKVKPNDDEKNGIPPTNEKNTRSSSKGLNDRLSDKESNHKQPLEKPFTPNNIGSKGLDAYGGKHPPLNPHANLKDGVVPNMVPVPIQVPVDSNKGPAKLPPLDAQPIRAVDGASNTTEKRKKKRKKKKHKENFERVEGTSETSEKRQENNSSLGDDSTKDEDVDANKSKKPNGHTSEIIPCDFSAEHTAIGSNDGAAEELTKNTSDGHALEDIGNISSSHHSTAEMRNNCTNDKASDELGNNSPNNRTVDLANNTSNLNSKATSLSSNRPTAYEHSNNSSTHQLSGSKSGLSGDCKKLESSNSSRTEAFSMGKEKSTVNGWNRGPIGPALKDIKSTIPGFQRQGRRKSSVDQHMLSFLTSARTMKAGVSGPSHHSGERRKSLINEDMDDTVGSRPERRSSVVRIKGSDNYNAPRRGSLNHIGIGDTGKLNKDRKVSVSIGDPAPDTGISSTSAVGHLRYTKPVINI